MKTTIHNVKKNRAKPFFVYLAANLIHTPLQPVPELAAEFDALGLADSTQKIYGMLRSVDNSFGKVRATLKELGLDDNTLFIFTTDNGPCSGSKPLDRQLAGLHGVKGTDIVARMKQQYEAWFDDVCARRLKPKH